MIGVVALLWNGLGVANFFVQMNPDALAEYPEALQAMIESRPAWATGAFAIAVIGGALGCLLLLLRKSAAYYVFIASLLGAAVTMIHTINVMAGSPDDYGIARIIGYVVSPLAVAALLIWYAKLAAGKGWIG